MRYSLKHLYPDLFKTLQVSKRDELVALPSKFGGDRAKAKATFEQGIRAVCANMHKCASADYPLTIYYGYKQNDEKGDEGAVSSSGWETMLSAIIDSGLSIVRTWPMRTELSNRNVARGTNALASSIVLVCRKRKENAGVCSRRQFVNALRSKLQPALDKLKQSNLAPVDMAQSAIGPGMEIFSQYEHVLEADGSPMSVRTALQIINQELDACLNEGGDRMDAASRFCIDLYSQYAYNKCKYGDADTLARAKNTSVEAMSKLGVLEASGGYVALKERDELPEESLRGENCLWLLTQQAAQALSKDGVVGCARLLAGKLNGEYADVKPLAYRLFALAEKRGWSQEAQVYNELVISWPEIEVQIDTERTTRNTEQQREFDFS